MSAPIVLLTDFGTRDSYVGVMKGVMAGIAPDIPLLDLSHEIRPQDVAHGAYTLHISVPYFPAGTHFCCVVDPGVGSSRRAVAVEVEAWRFILPDNGLLTWLLKRWPVQRAVTLTNPRYQLPAHSATFHGRDIFAPVTAHLARGVPLSELGEPIDPASLTRLAIAEVQHEGDDRVGTVLHSDRFGNLITTLTRETLDDSPDWTIRLTDSNLTLSRLHTTFAEVPIGAPVAYWGSDGFLELAIRNGNAAHTWQVTLGTPVIAQRTAPSSSFTDT